MTDTQLMLLDNIAYFSNISQRYTEKNRQYTIADLVQDYKNGNLNNTLAQVSGDDFDRIISYIEADEELMNLTFTSVSPNDDGTTGFCLQDSYNNLYVIFAGDYAYSKSWVDNFIGGVEESTDEQEAALKYYMSCIDSAEIVGNIYVSGHSKGGNLAQYVTLMANGKYAVDYCLSYDGQGFSNSFMKKYAAEIEQNGSKITSISANYDYVHCVLRGLLFSGCWSSVG